MSSGKVLIAILGLDQHEVGAMAVVSGLRDAGLEVVYAGRFNLPPGVVQAAIQEDVAVIGISVHSWEYLHYIDELLESLREQGAEIPVVVGGSVLTPDDERDLRARGVARAYGSSSTMGEIVTELTDLAGAQAQ